ncbi:MAG: hypothetical protein HN348_21915 [Proteobacteria bacterium]|nr:hypothetical protein [Pseudomonadota bacterium]
MQIIGVNGIGQPFSSIMTDHTDLPFIEDDKNHYVWTSWGVNYRDVIIVNQKNEVIDVFNLTQYSLSNSTNYETLRQKLISAAK